MILALTGGTGFVGSHLIDLAVAQGHHVRALARRPQPTRDGVTWIAGALDDAAALETLARGSEAVLHVAGVVNAADRAGFAAGNAAGTGAMLAAAQAAGVRRFVQISSLAAREPTLSDYGWSKAEGDAQVIASGLDWTIVRPPAIFGPRDTELLELFRLAKRHLVPLPPAGGRMSVLYVADLVRLLLTLAAGGDTHHAILEPDDGRPGGWDQRAFVRAIGASLGTWVAPIPLPAALLRAASVLDRGIRGARAKLTQDRVRYFCHSDWASHATPPASLWRSRTPTEQALAETVRWYRDHRLL